MGPPLRKGTGRSWPSKFILSSTTDTPAELFSGRRKHIRVTRSVLAPSLSPGQ
jgi:ribonuclease HI